MESVEGHNPRKVRDEFEVVDPGDDVTVAHKNHHCTPHRVLNAFPPDEVIAVIISLADSSLKISC